VDLTQLYGDVDNSLRITEGGLWHATPLEVLTTAVPLLETHVRMQNGFNILDAGAGDGRVLAALALGLAGSSGVKLWGLESDAVLLQDARTRLANLSTENQPVLGLGSYLSTADLASLGVPVARLDLVLNYPDGNEHALAQFLSKHASPRCCLAILSPETEPSVGFPASARFTVAPPGLSTTWTLSLFHPAATT